MPSNEELNAARLDAALKGDETKAQSEDVPYLRMAKALKAHASWEEGEMDPSVMDDQKNHLLQMANNLKEHRMQQQEAKAQDAGSKSQESRLKRPWYLWAGGAAVVAAVVLLLFVTQTGTIPFKNLSRSSQMAGLSRLSLIIPAANAADAFSMLVEKQGQGGADVGTTFRIESKVQVDTDTLNQNLKVIKISDQQETEVPYSLQKIGTDQFNVKPQNPLDGGSVYRVVIATAVSGDKGELVQRDFSWAVQTKDVFRIIRAVPGQAATGVPVDTAIEVMLSQTDWSDPAPYFEMTPAVKGKFETHGRTLVFMPEKPLALSTLYTVTFKKGWGLSGGPALADDYSFQFQTAREEKQQLHSLYLNSYMVESVPGTEPVVALQPDDVSAPVEITGYQVSYDDAKTVVQEIEKNPIWVDRMDIQNKVISSIAKSQSFNLSAKTEDTSYWMKAVRLPGNLPAGVYAVKLQQSNTEPAWALLQVTKLAAYMTADHDRIMVWTVNTETHKPLSAAVSLDGQNASTDDQGLAYLKTPEAWKSTSITTDKPAAILEFGVDDLKLLAVLRSQWGYRYYNGGNNEQAAFNSWAYVFADRPLYRSQDAINVFGLLQDRGNGHGVGKVTVQLQNYSFIDFSTYENKIFAQGEFDSDETGFWSGKLEWKGALSPGYYNIVVLRDGQQVATRSIEVRDTVKPAYYIQVLPDKKSVFAGDQVKGQVMVKFFDGTPVAKAKITLNASGGFMDRNQPLEVVTDDMGYAAFSFKTGVPGCNLQERYVTCGARDTLSVEARPSVGEEGEIYGYASYNIWRSRVYLSSESEKEDNGNGVIQYRVRQVDLNKENGRDQDSVLGEGAPGILVKAKVIEQQWEKVQTGNAYDPIEKKVVPLYRYDMRDVEAGNYESRTDNGGRVVINFPMKDNISYRVVAWVDQDNTQQAYTSYISRGWYSRSGSEVPSLEPTSQTDQRSSYRIGEKVSLSFVQNGQKVSSDNKSFLFIHAVRGLGPVSYSSDATHELEFTNTDVPTMTVYGVIFSQNGFVASSYSLRYDSSEKDLKITLEPDKTSYAPGSQVTFKAKVANKDGNPVSDARVAVTISDEALLSIAQLDSIEMPLDIIYGWLPDGIIATDMTHSLSMESGYGGGGAEMGGGLRANEVRRNFKDQASFMTLKTGSDGTATGSFTLPDNITAWRFTAVAITSDLKAGSARLSVPASKPLFVEAVIPQNILISDKAVLKLRAFGTALPKSGDITYTIDVPTLGINNQQVKGAVNKAVYLGLEHPVAGEHKAVISISIDGATQDAIERTVKIVTSRITHDERVSVELAPGTELPDPGQSSEVQLTFESKSRSAQRGKLEALANPWSARLESAVAGRVARELLTDYYQSTSTPANDIQITRFQRPTGGLGVLPYSSEDVALSSKVASADPNGVDRALLANYFWSVTDDQKASREESIQALAGLAALGQPVVERLHSLVGITDLSWRETLALARGLDAIGDREAARSLLDSLFTKADEHDGIMQIIVNKKSPAENIEATSEAAALAAAMSHPAAAKLTAFVESNWDKDTLTDLDRAMYLQKTVPTLVPADVQIVYAIGQETKTVDLKDQPIYTVNLTADEVRAFRAVSVNGPAAVSFVKRAQGEAMKSSDLLNVSRVYEKDGKPAGELHEGDLVTVSLTPSWDKKAQDGCYTLRDRLPAGFMPIVNISFDRYANSPLYYPYDTTGNEVSFVTCKQDKPLNIKYLARIVSLGTYTASGALLQSMEAPSLATVSTPMIIEVK
jgi:hypothetical protein